MVLQDNFLNNTSHTYTNNGSYNVKLAVRANNQCVDTITKKINVYAKPNVDFNVSNNKCIGQAIQFSDASTVSDNTTMSNWSWLFGGLGSSNQQNPSFVFAEQGNYTVQLNAGTSKGCSSIKVKNVTVTDPPLVDFSFTPTAGLPPLNVSFTNLSPAGSTFTWNYGDGSPNYVGFNSPPYIYNTIGNFPIQLSASNFLGCTNTVTKYIIVGSANVDVELLDVIPIQNNDYYKVLLNIRNNSNIPIYNLGLTIRLGNGTLIRETWNGVLLPNQTLAYNFTGEVRYNGTTDIPIICANIETINFNSTDDNLENNSSCKDFKIGDFNILTLYPNPTDNNINVGIMIPETGDLQINVYNYLGQQLFQQNMNASTGYNLINLDLSFLHAASYIIEAKYNNKVVRKPILKRQ
jgi:PKD repeat protein